MLTHKKKCIDKFKISKWFQAQYKNFDKHLGDQGDDNVKKKSSKCYFTSEITSPILIIRIYSMLTKFIK